MIKEENVDFNKEVKKTFDKYRKVVDDIALLKSYTAFAFVSSEE